MLKGLLLLRFRALLASFTAQARRKNKKAGVGTVILYAILYVYLIAVICGMMGMMFYGLAEAYHAMNLDWLYFAMAVVIGLGFGLLGSVFTSQSQLYDAKDNALLLSMPIPPGKILLSRMIPLLTLNLLFVAAVMVPAFVVYAIWVEFSLANLLFQLLILLGTVLLAQSIACVLGWLLHLLLSKINKSVASMVYMVVFLGLYFYLYSQSNTILTAIAIQGEAIAETLQTWVWPIYAAGKGCTGVWWMGLVYLAVSLAAIALVWLVLSATFLRSATMQRSSRRKKLRLDDRQGGTPMAAFIGKEWRKFLGCPVYLTNMGVGILMVAALTAAGVIFREDVATILSLLVPSNAVYLAVLMVVGNLASTMCVSTPSVSLEGKNIWIPKSMPLSSRQILMGKLIFHCLLTIPVLVVCTAVLCLTLGSGWLSALLAVLVAGLLGLFVGLLGMLAGLKWAKLDYVNEAYPCKQSVSVAVTMFSTMGLVLLGTLGYIFLPMDALLFGALIAMILGLGCIWMYFGLVGWGVRKWEALM